MTVLATVMVYRGQNVFRRYLRSIVEAGIAPDRLRTRAGSGLLYVEVPHFEQDVHDLSALHDVASFLVGERTMPTVIG